MMRAAAPAIANTDFTVLLDLDNNSATGCTVTTAAGTFTGADQRVITTVSNTSPLMVLAVVREVCVTAPSTWGNSTAINSPYATPWSVGEHAGTGGLDVVESYVPLTGIPHGLYRLGFMSSAGSGDALLTADGTPGGAAIRILNATATEIPTLGGWMLIALATTLVSVGFIVLRVPRVLPVLLVVLLLATAGVGVAWATLTPDGDPSGWAGFPPLAARTPVPLAGSSNIGAAFGTIVNDVLLLR